MISSRRSSGIPSGGLESEDPPGNPEAAEDASFQLFDLVHEEEDDPEAVATAGSSKVSTGPEEREGWASPDNSAQSLGVKSAHVRGGTRLRLTDG